MKFQFLLFALLPLAFQCSAQNQSSESTTDHTFELQKSEAEWKAELSPEAFYVLREKGTERAFTGKFNKFDDSGVFVCAACENPLFNSRTKFDSGTGWPSFYDVVGDTNVVAEPDHSHGWTRTEVLCGKCGGHLGHVFEDGPAPTGLRYCINSISLDFEPR